MTFKINKIPDKELSVTEEGSPIFTYHYAGISSLPYFHPVYAPNGEVVTADEDVGQQYPPGLCFTLGTIVASSEDSEQTYQAFMRRRDIVTPKPKGECLNFDLLSQWKLPEASTHLVSPSNLARFGSLAFIFSELLIVTVYPLQETEPRSSDTVNIENVSQSPSKNPSVRVFDVHVGVFGTPADLTFDGSTGLSYHAVDMEYPKVVDSEGRIGAAEANGGMAKWCTLGGIVANDAIGVAILPHPENGETLFFAEETAPGFLKAQTPSFTLKAEASLTLKYRVLVYVGDLFTVDVSDYYQDYIKAKHS